MGLLDREKKAKELGETQQSVGGLIFGIIPDIIAASKTVFEAVSHSFFLINWANEIFTLGWNALAYMWSYNKNAHKTGSLFFDWAKFGFTTFIVFGAAALVGIAQIATFGAMLALSPFANLVKTIYYTGRMIAADNSNEREAHWENVKTSVLDTLLSGLVGGCLAALLLIPGLNLATSITLATISSATLIPPVVVGLGAKLVKFGKWAGNRIGKWARKKQGLQGPGNQYDIRPGNGLESEDLEKNIIYIDKHATDGNRDNYLSYRFKDESGIVRKGTFKQYNLPADSLISAWPYDDLSEENIQKLRPHFNLFASSLLHAKKERVESAAHHPVENRLRAVPVPFKPVLTQTNNTVPHPKMVFSNPSEELNKYHAKERQNYHAHLSAPALKSVDEFLSEVQHQIHNLESSISKTHRGNHKFFKHFVQKQQEYKRNNKIEALTILRQALLQWNDLYKDSNPIDKHYHSIILDENTSISHILNPHLDTNITRNREIFIKRVQEYVLSQYPEAFQSFHREQGSAATLFEQSFNLMRSMKTEQEIEKERAAINTEIKAYEKKYQGVRRHFDTNDQQRKRSKSINLLCNVLNGNENENAAAIKAIKTDKDIISSRVGNGARWQLYQRIIALKESEDLLINAIRTRSNDFTY